MKQRKICIYAICKNEIKFVDKWLDNMSEANYIVVLDTGSTDGTFKKLKEDPRVTEVRKEIIKPWRFDVARNKSLELVPEDADILVCTDLDELFEPGWAKLLRDNWTDDTTRAHYTYAWSHNELGEPQDVFKYDKIHTKGYYWKFPVHEVLWYDEDKIEEHVLDFGEAIYLHHYPDKTKERKYYMDLLKLSCDENPDDPHVRMLYAREFCLQGNLEKSLQEFLDTIQMPAIDEPRFRLVLLNSLLQISMIYKDLKNYDECIWYAHEMIKEDPTYREPYLLLAEVYSDMKMNTLAEACVNAAKEYSYQHFDWVERATTFLGWMYDIESVIKYNLNKIDEAIESLEIALQHNPEDPRLLKNYVIFLKTKINNANIGK